MIWTDQQIEFLRERWAAGDSATVISAAMGCVSRNAVLGKVHRLEMPLRKTVAHQSRPRKPRSDKPRIVVKRVKPSRIADHCNVFDLKFSARVTKRQMDESKYANMTKGQLRAMLAEAVRNTAAMQ